METKAKIFEIIGQSLNGTPLSKEDQTILDNWISVSETNLSTFKKYKDLFSSGKDLKLLDEVNIEEAWNTLEREITKKRNPRVYPFLKYAAILLPILGLSVFLFFFLNKRANDLNYAALDQVHAGKPQAQLTLGSGETISLGKINKIIAKTAHLTIKSDSLGKIEYKNKGNTEAEYNTLYVPRAGEYKLILSDGTEVWLNSDTKLKYPTVFTGKNRTIYLEGEAYFEVTKSDKPFIVNVNNKAEVKVLGTHFNINAYKETSIIRTTLLEGSVQVSSSHNFSVILNPGEQASQNAQGKLNVETVNVNETIAWKKGLFSFNKISLEELGIAINRWYDVEVVFANAEAKEQLFTGAIEKYKSLKFLVQIMEETNTVKCQLRDTVLYIQ